MLEVTGGHRIYAEESGNPNGIPAVFLHGGPGSGCKADHRQFFDPECYRIILFDQRGAGRSEPYGGVEANTTHDLVSDLEVVRNHFGIEKWLLFGGSWGAALALVYAQTHPGRVLGMVLRGSFLARQADVLWFFKAGASLLLPEAWHRLLQAIGGHLPDDAIGFFHDQIFSENQPVSEKTAKAWGDWSLAVVTFSLDNIGENNSESMRALVAKAKIEMHYAKNGYFIAENQILDEVSKLPPVPVTIVHGMRDITCPAQSGWQLHQAIPGSEFELVRSAGHLSGEKPMIDALVRAADRMVDKLE